MTELKKMLNSNDPKKIRAVFAFERENSNELVRKKFIYWARWFFPQYFLHKITGESIKDAPFHEEMDMGNIVVYRGFNPEFLNVASRHLAKTTRTKLFIAFAIANDLDHHRKFIRNLTKDYANAVQNVTDVYNMLISPRVKGYYPEIFRKTETKREETMSSFDTSTGVKMVARSIGTEQRGKEKEEARPDFDWYEDIETRKTVMSAVVTFAIWQNMEEARTGLDKYGGSVYTCNYISERGNVHKLVQAIDHKIIIPIANKKDGKWIPTWDYFTPEDVARIEKDCRKRPDADFEGEYLCLPSAGKDVLFDRESLDRQEPKPVLEEIAGLKIFKKYNASHRIGSGHDVGGGVGLDHSTTAIIDFTAIPAQVAATYKSNEIKPDAFAHEVARHGKRYGECYAGVENNYGSTVDILKGIYPTDKIHMTEKPGHKVLYQNPTDYGWNTNAGTKPRMLHDLAHAVENGLLDLNDVDLIQECKSYTRGDLMDREIDPRLTTRHFDLLIAAAIAWQMRTYVKTPEAIEEEDYDMQMRIRQVQQERFKKTGANPAV